MTTDPVDPVDFATMMALESHGPDTFVGIGPQYPWGGLYGGQIVAQALRAAGATVDPAYRVHSLHAYFIRRGDHEEPIRFEVDRLRNGRSFVTRRVDARQSVGAILTLSASFQIDEEAPEIQVSAAPAVGPPDQFPSNGWSDQFDRRFVPEAVRPGRAIAWMRMTKPVGEDPLLHACALAYVSDDLPADAVVTQYPGISGVTHEGVMAISLDHAMWFHRPLHADGWHVFDFTCEGLMSSRGVAIGKVFDGHGVHVASVAQEVLVRRLKP
jgi:acyl-CoA thioesterase II